MSGLDNILTESRQTFFLAWDSKNSGKDLSKAIDLLAHQNIVTKNQLRKLFAGIVTEAYLKSTTINDMLALINKDIAQL